MSEILLLYLDPSAALLTADWLCELYAAGEGYISLE